MKTIHLWEIFLLLGHLIEERQGKIQKALHIQHLTNYFQSLDYQKENSKLFPVLKDIHNKEKECKEVLLSYKRQLIKFPYQRHLSMYNFLGTGLCYNIFSKIQLFSSFSTYLFSLKNMPVSYSTVIGNLAIDFYTYSRFDFISYCFSVNCQSGWLLNSWLDSATTPFLHFYRSPNTSNPHRAITTKPIILAIPGTYKPTRTDAIITTANKSKLIARAGNNRYIAAPKTISAKANPHGCVIPDNNSSTIVISPILFYISSRDLFDGHLEKSKMSNSFYLKRFLLDNSQKSFAGNLPNYLGNLVCIPYLVFPSFNEQDFSIFSSSPDHNMVTQPNFNIKSHSFYIYVSTYILSIYKHI